MKTRTEYNTNFKNIMGKCDNNTLVSNIVHGTLMKLNLGWTLQKAFFETCEYENLYGNRKHIVQIRKNVAGVLRNRYALIVNPTDKRWME